MAEQPVNQFSQARQYLESLAEMKEKNTLSESEYQDLHNFALEQLKRAMETAAPLPSAPAYAAPDDRPEVLSFGEIHEQIVKQLSGSFQEGDEVTKVAMMEAVTNLAEKRALYPGESRKINQIIEIVYTPFALIVPVQRDKVLNEILDILNRLYAACGAILNNPHSSAAAKAIADTVQRSAHVAATDARARTEAAEVENWFTALLKPDTGGAVVGASTSLGMLVIFPFVPPPVMAAIGAVVGAGIKSGEARQRLLGTQG